MSLFEEIYKLKRLGSTAVANEGMHQSQYFPYLKDRRQKSQPELSQSEGEDDGNVGTLKTEARTNFPRHKCE